MNLIEEEKNQKIIKEINSKLKDISFEEIVIKTGGHPKFSFYITNETMITDLGDLDLSFRSYNSLKRAGYSYIGEIVERFDRASDLKVIRNLGEKSAKEIMLRLFLYQFSILNPVEQERYLSKFRTLNKI